MVDGRNVVADVYEVLDRMSDFADRVRRQHSCSFTQYKSRHLCTDDKRRDLRSSVLSSSSLDKDSVEISKPGVRDKALMTVDDVCIAFQSSRCRDRSDIRSCLWFGKGKGRD